MRVGLMVAVIATAGKIASAQPTQPAASAPGPLPAATLPATTQPAAATPKEALTSLNLALRDGDAAAIRSLFLTTDEQGEKLIAAMADYASALAALHKAAVAAYGAGEANLVTGDIAAQSADGLKAIAMAEESQTGNTADVKFASATDSPVKLKKVDGRWRVTLDQLVTGVSKEDLARRLKELTAQARLARQTADELTAGKYREGASKAAEVWRSRLLEPGGGKKE